MFVYQPTVNKLEFKKDKGTDYIFSWKSRGEFTFKRKPLYAGFLRSKKLSEYKVRTKFEKDCLALEQNNYGTKIVNAYIYNKIFLFLV